MYSECKLGRSVSLILKLQKGFISISYHNQSVFPLRVLQYQFRFHLICMWTQAFENVCQYIALCTWNIRIQDFFSQYCKTWVKAKSTVIPFIFISLVLKIFSMEVSEHGELRKKYPILFCVGIS